MPVNDEIMQIRDKIVEAVPTEKLYLFGSYAYGTPNEDSDYDFYVVLSNNCGVRPIEAIQRIYRLMRGMERKSVDVLAGTVEIFERRSTQLTLERTIAKDGVMLYERAQ
ncbi:MAG: nucleotidyltransferase domain-containing protein [Oscillospiraceae bacterium]|jgi:predicted nucleotidyltransferase|nr:nucleotidyltransferase domain-containing protein [Oscillospiraceae bacterium]